MRDGRLLASALALAHHDERRRLRRYCPQAAPTGIVLGDTCLDRLSASLADRDAHRAAWGVRDGRRLILLSSTWTRASLFGRYPELAGRLLAALPADEYRVGLSLHPSIWQGHGRRQVAAWLRRAQRSGLLLVPEEDGWRSALLAADLLIGDHGSVTIYAAALGARTAVVPFPLDAVDPDSPAARLAGTAPRLDPDGPLRRQVERLLDSAPVRFPPALVSSAPGYAHAHTQHLLYAMLGLSRPRTPAVAERLEVCPPRAHGAAAWLVDGIVRDDVVFLERFPVDLDEDPEHPCDDGHLVVDARHPRPALVELADIVLVPAGGDGAGGGALGDGRFGGGAGTGTGTDDGGAGGDRVLAEAVRRNPGCLLAASVHSGRCWIRTRNGRLVRVDTASGADPALFASAVYAWLSLRGASAELPGELTVRTGTRMHTGIVSPG